MSVDRDAPADRERAVAATTAADDRAPSAPTTQPLIN
jgi:hypothetical protein